MPYFTRIIVMEVKGEDEVFVLGALADAMHEVMELEADQIEPTPRIGSRWQNEFSCGLGKH